MCVGLHDSRGKSGDAERSPGVCKESKLFSGPQFPRANEYETDIPSGGCFPEDRKEFSGQEPWSATVACCHHRENNECENKNP